MSRFRMQRGARKKGGDDDLLLLLVALRSAALSGGSVLSITHECIRDYGNAFLTHAYQATLENQDPISALREDARTLNMQDLHSLADVLETARVTGAPIQPPVDRIIKLVQRNLQHDRELTQELAGARATIAVLSLLPLFGPVLGYLLGVNIATWLFTTMWGFACLVVGLTLEALGWAWMRILIRQVMASD